MVSDEPDFFCPAYDTIAIEFCCPVDLKLPNVITPSDYNNINDFFSMPENSPYKEVNIYIYDRWEKRVFYSSDPEFRWNGTVNCKIEKGVYYYVIDMLKECSFHGSITVL